MTKTDHTKHPFATGTQNGSTITIHHPEKDVAPEQLTDQLLKTINRNTKEITGQPAKRWIIKIEK